MSGTCRRVSQPDTLAIHGVNSGVEPADLPILYSFRRCPYAIRARLATHSAGIRVALREVVLRDKPAAMLEASPKATVPVLVIRAGAADQEVIAESLDIMFWSLAQHDPDGWLDTDIQQANQLIEANDDQFKPWLDRYKYPDRYERLEPGEALAHCRVFLDELERRLQAQPYLCGDRAVIADYGIYPFVRQFALADMEWFRSSPYTAVSRWLQEFLDSAIFAAVLQKFPQWQPGDPVTVF
jgi:glutathione S-transferase